MSASIKCGSCQSTHTSVAEVRDCHNLNHAATQAPAPEPIHKLATPAQLKFIADLGGDVEDAKHFSVRAASVYIQQLKNAADQLKTATRAQTGSKSLEPQHALMQFLSLLESIPEGYYAVQPDTETPLSFLRLSRPKSKNISERWKGTTKIQTIHGPNLDIAWACWPNGQVRSYKHGIEDKIMLLISNFQSAALRYAREIGHCARCNLRLTDEQSRRRGVGPECIKHWPWAADNDEAEDES